MTHCYHEWPMGSWPCCLSASPNGTGVIQDEYRTEETDTWCLVDYMDYPILPDTHLEICQSSLFLGHIANRRTNPSKQIPVTSHCLEKSPCKSSKHLHDQSCHEFTLMTFIDGSRFNHVTSPCGNGRHLSLLHWESWAFYPIPIAFGESFIAIDTHPKPEEWHIS